MLEGWGKWFFSNVYGDAEANAVASEHANLVREPLKGHHQVFVVPREPLVALVTNQAAGDLISDSTVESASLALYWVGVFNQLVQQETDYNALHLAEIRGEVISGADREGIARGVFSISQMIHGTGIARAAQQDGWYQRLTHDVRRDVDRLSAQVARPWWLTVTVGLAAVLTVVALALSIWAAVDTNASRGFHRHHADGAGIQHP
jgi:hypothetical protein